MKDKIWCMNCGAEFPPNYKEDTCKYCGSKLKDEKAGGEKPVESFILSRFYYTLELLLILLINWTVKLLLLYGFPIDKENPTPYMLILYFGENAVALTVASVIGLLMIHPLFHTKEKYPAPGFPSPLRDVFEQLVPKRKNILHQIKYGILLLFFIFIPIDFISYAIPGVLEFSKKALTSSFAGKYILIGDFSVFIISIIIIHFFVAFREELFFRGVGVTRGRRHMGDESAVFITALFFGLAHFTYIFAGTDVVRDLVPSVIWGASAFFVGFVGALFMIKKRYLWSVIIAHMVNNIISATALRLFDPTGNPPITFREIALTLYIPLLLCTLILIPIFRKDIKSALKWFFEFPGKYKKNLAKETSDVSFIFIFDLFVGLLLFFVGIIFF